MEEDAAEASAEGRDRDATATAAADGIFFEFIPADRYFDENPPRLGIGEVELGTQ